VRTLLKAIAILIAIWFYAILVASASTLEDGIQSTAVHIVTKNTECSGVLIDSTHILTARHCTKEAFDYVEIAGSSKRYCNFGTVRKSPTADIALIELLDAGTHPAAIIAENSPVRGDALTLIGLSYDVTWALSRGFVMSAEPQEVNYKHDPVTYHATVIACMGCDEGDSGAGVFNSAGEVVGVFIASSENGVRTYMATLSDIKKFLHG
jgi:S1-C subfamily serine protease